MTTTLKLFATGLFCILLYSCVWIKGNIPDVLAETDVCIDNKTEQYIVLRMAYNLYEDAYYRCPPNQHTKMFFVLTYQGISHIFNDFKSLKICKEEFTLDVNSDDPLSTYFCNEENWLAIQYPSDNGLYTIDTFTLTLEQEAFDKLLEETRSYYDKSSAEVE